jgi:ABC-type Mn2+/Zn2+ transport system permease subunit
MIGYDPSLVSIVVTFFAVFVLALATRRSGRFPAEALIAIVYMLASAAAILLIAKNPQGETEIMNVLFGNILTVNARQLWEAFGVGIATFLCLVVFFRSLLFSAFDPEMAMTCGLNSALWQALFYVMLGAEIVVGIRMSGALPTFAYLVIPAYAGLRLSRRMSGVVLWSVVVGPISTFIGLWLSFNYDLPTGPTITETLVAAGILSIAACNLSSRN